MREDFIKAIKKAGGWRVRNCTMCGAGLTIFYKGNQLYFRSSCYCVTTYNIQKRSEDDIDVYLRPSQGHLERIKLFIKENTNVCAENSTECGA